MALNVSVDVSKTPIEMTVTSDKRVVGVEVKSAGEVAVGEAVFPVVITNGGGYTWTKKSDNNVVAVYTGA